MRLIYALIDPRSKLVRYIGKSTTGMQRPRSHARPSRALNQTHCARWIAQLRREQLTYQITILEEIDSTISLEACEIWWIAFGRACGWPLTNHTDGGDGAPGRLWSEASRNKLRGRKHRTESIELMRTAALGNQRTLGRHHTIEAKQKMSAAKLRFHAEYGHTDEVKKKIATTKKARAVATNKPCGTMAAYRRGCRCDACRKARAMAHKAYRGRVGATL